MKLYKLYKNVEVGREARIEEYVLIGKPPKGKKEGELKTVIGDNALIRSHSIIYAGVIAGDYFQTGDRATIRENCTFGNRVCVGSDSVVLNDVKLEDNVTLHTGVFMPEHARVGSNTWIGPRAVLTNTPHPRCPAAKKCMKEGAPRVGRNVKIGANAIILPYVKVGDNVLIGAGSVVTRSVPKNSVVVGNPARVVKRIDEIKCPYKLVDKPY